MNGRKRIGYVYEFFNGSDELLYVGSTGDIDKRMYDHFFSSVRGRNHSKKSLVGFKEVTEIRYCEMPTRNDALIAETILIQRYKPPLNVASVKDGAVSLASFDESSAVWKTAVPKHFSRSNENSDGHYKAKPIAGKQHKVFNALRELYPDADLRKNAITKVQKWVLYAALMLSEDGDYWAARMTDFEFELAMDQFYEELARRGVFMGGTNE